MTPYLLLAREDLEWRFESAPAPYVLLVVVLGVLAFVITTYLLEPKPAEGQSRASRVFLGVLRAAALLLAIGILFRPVERKETRETKDGYVVVAIDKSRSMSLKDREGDENWRIRMGVQMGGVAPSQVRDMDRLTRVKKVVTNERQKFLDRLAERNKIKVYAFDATRTRLADVPKIERRREKDEKTEGLSPEVALGRAALEIQNLEADGPATAVGDSLQKVLTDLRSEKVAALVLLTDGRSNAGSNLPPELVASRYGKKAIPIYAIGVGDPNPPKDLIVENLEAPEVTIAGDEVLFTCVLKAQGYEAQRDVDVELVFDGHVVKREKHRLGGDQPEKIAQVRFKPDREGEFNVEVRIVPDENEITVENNKAIHHLRVIASKIKVLYVEGYPRWEYRYLKNALVRDQKIEVQCLLLSADPGFPQEHSAGVPPLRGFPSREELFQYHVVIFGDVNPRAATWDGRPVFGDGALENVKEFVADQGGGFLMISGEQDSPRRYADTPLAPILPIVIDDQESGSRERTEWSEKWNPRLTREGVKWPPLRLEADSQKNQDLWEGSNPLPGFFWYARALKPKPLAHVLAEHPNDRNQNGAYPIWAWQYYKAGTVFWSAVDETWRWRAGIGDRYVYRFYGQVLRFLANARFQRGKRFIVTTDKSKYVVGEEARIHARVLDRKLAPATEKTQEVVIDRPDAQNEKLELKLIEGKPGDYEGRYKPLKVGAYKVSIDPGSAGSDGDVAPRIFEVKFPSIELEEPRMDREALEAVAKQSGGKFLPLDRIHEVPDLIPPMTETVAASAQERELWDNPAVLAVFMALLIVEWVGRKVARLL